MIVILTSIASWILGFLIAILVSKLLNRHMVRTRLKFKKIEYTPLRDYSQRRQSIKVV
jgi:hypothetical protein